MDKLLRFLFSRLVIVGLLIVFQVLALVLVIWKFANYFVYFYAFCAVLSLLVVLKIVSDDSNPAYKIAWIILIMLLPILGGLFYVMFGQNTTSKSIKKKMKSVENHVKNSLEQDPAIMDEVKNLDKNAANQMCYIEKFSYCPVYKNTTTSYLSPGEVKFEKLLNELKKAEHYIFMEYFIIEEGKMWDSILNVLAEKAKQGLDVRVIYDDMGCLMLIPGDYNKRLEKLGIKCCVFNRFVPALSIRMNNRDHRKIAVIDGHTAFTGGINLADEYINAIEKHGHWKDASIVLHGDAAWSFTVMFLSLWNYITKTDESYERYKPHFYDGSVFESDGYVQPFTDSPFDDESIGENVYLNLINKAKNYAYINTPYLIIDNEMTTSLINAAKCGVDVRIVTPHIGDKWFVHAVTRSNYKILVENGVKVYEYTPGFIHSKTFVVDDEYAVVGTINLDYRSLYLHFECGALMYKTKSVLELKDDYIETLNKCHEITVQDCKSVKASVRLIRSVLKVFAPLM